MIKKTLKINGVERILILDKDETLAQVLRNHLLLTGCKIGCDCTAVSEGPPPTYEA